MGLALEEAAAAPAHGDVPIGAVVVGPDGAVIARRHNERELHRRPDRPRRAPRPARRRRPPRRAGASTAASWCRPSSPARCAPAPPWPPGSTTVVFGAADPKAGACGSLYNLAADPRLNHDMAVIPGVREDEAATLIRRFFADRRTGGI